MHVDLDILAYAIIAALLLGRLWSVFGTRNDSDPQRPNPFTPPQAQPVATPPSATAPIAARLLPVGPPPNSLAGGLAQVQAIDPTFDEKAFLRERRDVFATILSAYAAGNVTSIGEFLSPAVQAQFQNAITAREQAGQKAETRIAKTEAEVTAARAEGTQAFVTVKFVSTQENILRDASGAVIGGEQGRYEEVSDIWTFARDTQSPNAKWVLVETRG